MATNKKTHHSANTAGWIVHVSDTMKKQRTLKVEAMRSHDC